MTQSAKLKLEYLQNNAANQTLANTTFAALDQIVQAGVKDKDLATPPGSPGDGDAYIVASSPTGAWSGKAGQIAYWLTAAGAWQFIVPLAGWMVSVLDELDSAGLPTIYGYTGSAWAVPAGSGGMSNPMTTAGDLIVGGASGSPARLAKGADGKVLTMVSGGVAWADATGGAASGFSTASISSGAINLSNDAIAVWKVSLTADISSISLPTALVGEALSVLVLFIQDGTGGRTVSGWPSVVWESGSAPTIGSAAGAITSVPLLILGDGTVYGVN